MTVSLWAYSVAQEKGMREQNERSMTQTVESVIKGLQSVMLAGDADIAQAFSDRLKTVEGAQDFRILRVDGSEAFRDNQTIRAVNKYKGEDAFSERDEETVVPVLPKDSPELQRATAGEKAIPLYTNAGPDGKPSMTMLAPIMTTRGCKKCHGDEAKMLGFIKFSVTLAALERDIAAANQRAVGLIAASLLLTLIFTAAILRHSVSKPIAQVTEAMRKAAGGDLNSQAIASGNDEVAQMAASFNTMTSSLKRAYDGMQREQDKLTTIIRSAKEAIIVADATDKVTLVNPSAEVLLGKTIHDISHASFVDILDDRELMARLLNDPEGTPEIIRRGELILSAQASRINADDGHLAGSAALIRDITIEKNLEDELRKLSTTDGLTGLFNRRFLDDTLRKELARAQRYGHALSVLMLDVDHFKKFNDRHGHEMGDRVLKAVAGAMYATLRQQDYPCRYGGEEFLAILPDTASAGALNAAERLRHAICTLSVEGLSVTASIGCASFPELEVQTADELVEQADGALYQAKEGGRNRCVLALGEHVTDAVDTAN
ncbi:MAG TPA: diguanylate cyclase [Aromatoleum sp.]|uniref:sensor domain-containing diguanylate cyclase n=1 Tax=Aromatoleum sp. TaxID=2307007 RepID=UPI002B45A915|nr:diguanylate cyclase [Aromatoleum sp.]HJV28837.1 diguanylate cyclase [Aromatoleum sp.]